MSASRTRERERNCRPIETTDPAGLAVYAAELRSLVAVLRAGVEDATLPPSRRQRARVALRKEMLKALRALEARLDAAQVHEARTAPSPA